MDDLIGKRLVVFGCGYVGGALARQAVARGLQVTALTRNPATAEELRRAGIEVVVADLAGTDWQSRIPRAPDFVANTVSAGGGGVEGYRRSYVEGMRAVIAWARQAGGAGTLVYTSSTSVYAQDGGVTVDETAPTEGGGERAELLRAAEQLLQASRAAGDEPGAPACGRYFILRLAGIYGPGRHHLVEQVRSGAVAGAGSHHLNLIHRDDICAALWAVLRAPATIADEIFNVADDGAATKAEIVAWLAARLGVAAPGFTGSPAAGRRAVTPDRIIANAKLKRRLGWRPQWADFRAGYENVLAAGGV